MMNAHSQSTLYRGRPRAWVGALALLLAPVLAQADSRSVYELSYAFGEESRPSLEAYSTSDVLRPGFRSEAPRGRELSLGVRSTRQPSALVPGLAEQSVETTGGFIHRLGDTGFGYGVDFGLGLYASAWDQPPDAAGAAFVGHSSLLVSDFSAGPTYESGNLLSRVRVGVRYPVFGEGDSHSSFYGHRGDAARGAGYLSLDSRLRFSNQTEMSVSLFYDDHSAGNALNWLDGGLDFRGGVNAGRSVVGVEMGLNF
jgi:hypothetical protein